MVSIGETDRKFNKAIDRYDIEKDEVLSNFNKYPLTKARTVMFDGNQTMIRMRNYPESAKDRGLLSHEIFHAVDFILDRIGMKLIQESCEAYAYLIDYITRKIYEHIEGKQNE